MSVEHVSGSQPARTHQQADTELHLASTDSDDGKAWNAGLLLGVVSEFSRAMRFDPTTTSARGFQHFTGLLQSTVCLFVEAIPHRETLLTHFAEFINGINSCYGTESHAELLGAWRRGEIETGDLRNPTCEPPNLGGLQELVEQSVPEGARPAFLVGIVAGESWVRCLYLLRTDLPDTTLRRVFVLPIPTSASSATQDPPCALQIQLEPELESRVSLLFRSRGWNIEEWHSAILSGGRDEDEWNQLNALNVGISWISRRISTNVQNDLEAVANPAEFGDQESNPSDEAEHPQANDGFVNAGYLGISYSEIARAVRREGYDTLLRFEGRLVPWHLFWTLVRRCDQWTDRGALRSCWQAAGRSEPESNENNVIDRAISDLRDLLIPLGLRVTNNPGVGWRLEELVA